MKLVGFKSFADRTRLELRPGVTVVVGPNGSGKSNIVDAVAWVMGTQSAKSLRTDKMDDVIFAGTATRPGLGRAEVTLVFDNSAGMLPLDLPEVAITRRLYRDGSSDYEINGVGCRLLDIQELLSDSHVGRHQHVIIGQGQIDSVLNAGPEDHRAVIEEAAGILKHRVRKDKAIRRLERTDADVLRLRDLLGELARQMRPLRRQAEAATRHHEVAAAARSLRLYLAGEELRRMTARRSAIEAADGELMTIITSAEARSLHLGEELAVLRSAAGEVGEALDRDTSAAARLETTIERLRRIGQVAEERHRAASARLEGADERRRDLSVELAEIEAQVERLSVEAAESGRRVEEAERRFRQAEDEERSLADQEGMSTEGAIAVVRGDLRAMDAADERDAREEAATARRAEAIAAQIETEQAQIAALKQEIKDVDRLVGSSQQRYSEAEAKRKEAQEGWERAESQHRAAELAFTAAAARVTALEAAVAGLADPEARGLVESAPGALGSLTRRLDVPEDLGGAVDAALGPWADSVAFESPQALAAAVGLVKGAGLGGLPVVRELREPAESAARRLAGSIGVEALIDLLGPGADRRLALSLLGDVVLVEGWSSAWTIVQAHPEVRAVTPEGDLITIDGVRIALPNGATPAMLDSALGGREASEIALARAASLFTSARRAFEESRSIERDTLETLESLEAQLAGVTEAVGRLERSVLALSEEAARLAERLASLAASRGERQAQRINLDSRLAALEGEEAERQRIWEEIGRRRREASQRREEARAGWQEAESLNRAIAERLAMAGGRRVDITRSLEAESSGPLEGVSLERLSVIAARARLALDLSRAHLEVLRRRQADLRGRAGVTGTKLGEVQDILARLTAEITQARERRHHDEIEAAELRVRLESVAEGLRRDLDVDEEAALAATRPEFDTEDLAGALASREAELRRMGPINPLAAVEYAELEERHDFLSTQLDDLERSRSELRTVIERLDHEIEVQFGAAYEEIAAAFQEHFSVLFPGGTGRLRLTDPEDRLRTGVEIEAQPLGKKVAKMSLLSGGERSLAALAFMFAVFKARPSPFYILDEVEAALDDANLRRFLRLLDRFRASAQLLVVTHQQQTMETADVLYGVTMEPGGSSKVVVKPLAVLDLEDAAV